jgi:hypothetical protein
MHGLGPNVGFRNVVSVAAEKAWGGAKKFRPAKRVGGSAVWQSARGGIR